jgi:hypothetical protein
MSMMAMRHARAREAQADPLAEAIDRISLA